MRKITPGFLLLSLLLAKNAYAWNGTGHMVIAAIAYHQLPIEKRKVYSELLQHHPDFPKWQSNQPQSLPENDFGLYLFMRASTWPDELRAHRETSSNEDIHQKWHFIEVPVASTNADLRSALDKDDNILTGIAQCEGVLQDATKSPQERAVALSWLIHLFGDIHQPLHCASMISERYPGGDRGGNLVSIRLPTDARVRSLHALWDGLLGGEPDDVLGDPAVAVNAISSIPNISLNDISSNTTPATWVQQSCRVAYETAYLSGRFVGGTRQTPIELPGDYLSTAQYVAKGRAALSGYWIPRKLENITVANPVPDAGRTASGQTPTGSFFDWTLSKIKNVSGSPLTIIGGIVSAYLISMMALVVLAWYGRVSFAKKNRLLSPTWLITKATQLLLVAPGLGRGALFIGYRRRLAMLDAIQQANAKYFGLPATLNGEPIAYDATGDRLHERICSELGSQKPVMLVGKGGAGKSTLLARLAALSLKDSLPDSLKGYSPVYLSALYYREDLIQAITTVLRERDGVNVTKDIVNSQLQSGQFLILLDGVSEVEQEDKAKAVNDVLRAARSAEYRACRFIITTRPIDGLPTDTPLFELQPLTKEFLLELIPRYALDTAGETQLKRQLQSFGDKPIEPLLFTMAVSESGTQQVSATRTGLYERYFRTLLRIKSNDNLSWKGWQDALENIAEWSLLETGKRGIGLRHQDLVNHISREVEEGGIKENLVKRVNRLYRLAIKGELDLLDKLSSAGLLLSERRWRFAHDTFEEYFAASRIVSFFDQNNVWPNLNEWKGKEREFLEVIDFVAELVDARLLETMLRMDLPLPWKEHLQQISYK